MNVTHKQMDTIFTLREEEETDLVNVDAYLYKFIK